MVTVRGLFMKVLSFSVVGVFAFVAYTGVSSLRADESRRSRPKPSASRADSSRVRINPFAAANGVNMVAYLITASDCGWSNRPVTMKEMGDLRRALRAAYGKSYAQVVVIGVALDKDPSVGLAFLGKLGDGKIDHTFDQVAVGGSWLNDQIVRFVWRDGMAKAISPQVIVVERPVDATTYVAHGTLGVKEDRLLANPVGTIGIDEWVKSGFPLTPPKAAPLAGMPQAAPQAGVSR